MEVHEKVEYPPAKACLKRENSNIQNSCPAAGSVFDQDADQVSHGQGTGNGKKRQQDDVNPAEIRNHDGHQNRLDGSIT